MWFTLRVCVRYAVAVIVLADAFLSVYFNGAQRWTADTRDYVLTAVGFFLVFATLFFLAALLGLKDPEKEAISETKKTGP